MSEAQRKGENRWLTVKIAARFLIFPFCALRAGFGFKAIFDFACPHPGLPVPYSHDVARQRPAVARSLCGATGPSGAGGDCAATHGDGARRGTATGARSAP